MFYVKPRGGNNNVSFCIVLFIWSHYITGSEFSFLIV